ncbi:MAG: hypothetical protein JO262_16660 [Solirubrobacterales bacterium]|nr:hypothetical protein [Solirubrobacterales bacterium]MBV9943762.1 hypothetical protein [Solirubrobacterales bacterium]
MEKPGLTDACVREDLRRFTGSLRRETTLATGAGLPEFGQPALVAMSGDDAFFPVEDGRRLAAALHGAWLEVSPRSRRSR